MIKKSIALVLTILLLVSTVLPTFSIAAEATSKNVVIHAEADNNISISKKEELPDEYDYDGKLYLWGGTFDIERDYNQICTITVSNYSEKTVEYYLEAKNTYSDIYLNFVRNGSVDVPLVIEPGSAQEVKLDVFAQNAKSDYYEIPIYATIISDNEKKIDSKTTVYLNCNSAYFDFDCKEIDSNETTLEKTFRLTNNGDEITDVSVSLNGDVKDYVSLNPIVSNFRMGKGQFVNIEATPDLTKMKENGLSFIEGSLVVSGGNESCSFNIGFDTEGREITSSTMGKLALKQSGNPFYYIELDKNSGTFALGFDKDGFNCKRTAALVYDNEKQINISMSITGRSGKTSQKNEISFDTDGSYSLNLSSVISKEEYIKLATELGLYGFLSGNGITDIPEYETFSSNEYTVSYKISIVDLLSKTAAEAKQNLKLLALAISGSPSNYLFKDPNAKDDDILMLCKEYILSVLLNVEKVPEYKQEESDTPIDNAVLSNPKEYYVENKTYARLATVEIPSGEFKKFHSINQIDFDKKVDPDFDYSYVNVDGKKIYSTKNKIYFELDNILYACNISYVEQENGLFSKLISGYGMKISKKVKKAVKKGNPAYDAAKNVGDICGKVVYSVNGDDMLDSYMGILGDIESIADANVTYREDAELLSNVETLIKRAKEFDTTSDGKLTLIALELELNVARSTVDSEQYMKALNKIAQKSFDAEYPDGGVSVRTLKSLTDVVLDKHFSCLEEQARSANKTIINDLYSRVLDYYRELFNEQQELIEKYGREEGMRRFLEKYGGQCTNAGKITTDAYIEKGSVGKKDEQPSPEVSGVEISKNSVTGNAGDSVHISAKVVPSDAKPNKITWTSSNEGVASVDSNGNVTLNESGTAVITAKAGGKSETCSVTVNKQKCSVRLNLEDNRLPVGKIVPVSIIVTNADGDETEFGISTLISEDADILEITEDNMLSAIAYGTTTITAVAETENGTFTCTSVVEVKLPAAGVLYSGIIYSPDGIGVNETFNLESHVYPEKAIQDVTWSSSDPETVFVDETGVVKTLKPGSAKITVTSKDGGFTYSKEIVVVEKDSEENAFEAATLNKEIKTETENESVGSSFYITSRMFGGDGVKRWYGSADPDYVDIANTKYYYTINGVDAGVSYNNGVTDVAIAKLPTNLLKFGANNRIVCDYDTNPGHYFVNTDTQISIIYPSETPVSFIGTPDDLKDVRSLPDFAVYSENIFGSSDAIIGSKATGAFNVYNRGAGGGWCDIIVKAGEEVIYEESNHYFESFSGDKIVFEWIPKSDEQRISVTLVNKTVDTEEYDALNNTAERTFTARRRVVPNIESISPDYAVEKEGLIFAEVSNYNDVKRAEFYIDDVLYKGEVKSAILDGVKRFWINDSDIAVGERNVKCIVYYSSGAETEAKVECTGKIRVLKKDWNKYHLRISNDFSDPRCYIYDVKNDSYERVYDFSRNAEDCVITISKAMYDEPSRYMLYIAADEGFFFKCLSETNKDFTKESSSHLTVKGFENLNVNRIYVESFNDYYCDCRLYDSELYMTPGKYTVNISFDYLDEYKNIKIQVDLSSGDYVLDLLKYIPKYQFKLVGTDAEQAIATMYLKDSETLQWQPYDMTQSIQNDTLSCIMPSYYSYELNNASQAFILICTDDCIFRTDISLENQNYSKVIELNKADLQKYAVSAGQDPDDFEIFEVRINCDEFSVSLYKTPIYVSDGDYEISVFAKHKEDYEQNGDVANSTSDFNTIILDWAESYAGVSANIVGLLNEKVAFTKVDAKRNTEIAVNEGAYTVKTTLLRNDSRYQITSSVKAENKENRITIDNSFNGKITNTFGNYKGESTVSVFLGSLFDKYGNVLSSFSSQSQEDNLYGIMTLTDVSDESNYYTVPIELDSVDSFEAKLPNVDGTFKVSIEVGADSELVEPYIPVDAEKIELNQTEIKLNCESMYTLFASFVPEDAQTEPLVWSSSNEKIATVDENGIVKTQKTRGTAIITVATEDGRLKAECRVVVKFSFVQWLRWFFTFGFIRDLFNK